MTVQDLIEDPPYHIDGASSHYHIFRSMERFPRGKSFLLQQVLKIHSKKMLHLHFTKGNQRVCLEIVTNDEYYIVD